MTYAFISEKCLYDGFDAYGTSYGSDRRVFYVAFEDHPDRDEVFDADDMGTAQSYIVSKHDDLPLIEFIECEA